FAVVQMAGGHEPETLRFLLVRTLRYLQEVADHARDEFDQGRGRWLLPEQVREIRIGFAFFCEDFSIKRCFRRKMLEQQSFRNGRRGRNAFGRGPGEAVAGKTALRSAQD